MKNIYIADVIIKTRVIAVGGNGVGSAVEEYQDNVVFTAEKPATIASIVEGVRKALRG